MPESTNATADIRQLDGGYSREARSLLYQAYLEEPSFAYLFESQRPGYEQRVRATIRELVKQHFTQDLPALGMFIEDRLIGVALIAPPQRRLRITESWMWLLRMVMSAGLRSTQRYLAYHESVLSCLPSEAVHILPLLAIRRDFQHQRYGEQLLQALHDWCAVDENSQGVVLDTGNDNYLEFYRRQGYEEIGEIAVGPVREHVFFHPNPQVSLGSMA